jgi:hypothetical protein
MHHCVAASQRRPQRFRREQVPNDSLARHSFKILKIAGFANQKPKVGSLSGKRPRHMMAHKSRSACKKNFHSFESQTPS